MYDYHPDIVCILFLRSHPYIFYIQYKKCFLLLVYFSTITSLHSFTFLRNLFYYLLMLAMLLAINLVETAFHRLIKL